MSKQHPNGIPAVTRRKIAVVDNDPGMLTALRRLLSAHEIDVECYGSAEAYLKVAAEDNVDCLILDIHLPGMSGIDLGRAISAMRHAPPVIFITGYNNPSVVEDVAKSEYVAFLRKPFEAKSLLDAIDKATTG